MAMRFRSHVATVGLVLLFQGLSAGPARAEKNPARPPSEPAKANVILDRNTYFQVYTEFGLMKLNSDILKSDGEKLFGKGLPRIETYVKRLFKSQNYDWNKTDWRDVAGYLMISAQCGDNTDAMGVMPTVPPPSDWMKPEFDDSAFDRQRLGTMPPAGNYGVAGRLSSSMMRRGLCMRTYFQVADPAKAGNLTLQLTFRGGARVFLNGQEIGRGHLPDGPIGPNVFGADYPMEAYLGGPDEIPAASLKKDLGDFVGELRCPFDMAASPGKELADYRLAFGGALVTRKGWDRIMKLRDRVLGPIAIPAGLLQKGPNTLAIELRSSRYHPLVVPGARAGEHPNLGRAWNLCWIGSEAALLEWDHVALLDLQLRSSSANLASGVEPSPGLRVWVDDVHRRLCDKDFNPAGWPAGTARFVGGPNGTFGAQLGMTADKEIQNLKVVAGDLAGAGGAKIPAAALQIEYGIGHDLSEMAALGFDRCAPSELTGYCRLAFALLYRYASPKDVGSLPKGDGGNVTLPDSLKLKFFDHISASAPKRIPAKTCQPLWLSLKIPADAPPGKYKGTCTVEALGEKATVPLEAEVFGWRVPDPKDFQFFVQSEQSPYGIANHYKVELWSEKHMQLIESSFRQLARIGNRWIFVPVVMNSELGNRENTMIGWIRKKDGSLAFDYTLLDRYLALAQKAGMRPQAVCFVVMQAVPAPAPVKILDEATGRTDVVELGTEGGEARRALWQKFAIALQAHMKTLGLDDVMYWGQVFDDVPDKYLIAIMAEAAPGVPWTSAGHYRAPDATFRLAAHAYGVDVTDKSFKGWSNPLIDLLMTRCGGSIICVEGVSSPFTWRVMCDRAIYCGFRGVGRIGADYFDRTWFDGVKGGYWNMVGRAMVQSLWPGENSVDTGTCNEALLEGIQEAEARIYLEQALDRKVLPADLAREAQAVLDGHLRGTLHILTGWPDPKTMDLTNEWQARSRRLYQMAARVAEKTGLDVDRTAFGESTLTAEMTDGILGAFGGAAPHKISITGGKLFVPELGRTRLPLTLRNWTGKPRQWKASSKAAWIIPEKTEGSVIGQEELGIIVDGKTLKAGANVSGTFTLTDVAVGTVYSVQIAATVEKGFELQTRREIEFWTGGGSGSEMPKLVHYVLEPVLNVSTGASETREYLLANRTAQKQVWKIESDCPGVTVEPAAGEIAPGTSLPVKIVARPAGKDGAALEATLTLSAVGGAIKDVSKIKVYIIPPYQAPTAPAGEAVYLNDLDQKKFVKSHTESGCVSGGRIWWIGNPWYSFIGRPYLDQDNNAIKRENYNTTPFTMGGKSFTYGLWVSPTHETVYAIEGAGFAAFAAEVGFYDKIKNTRITTGSVVSFEIYVDGKLRAQSGLMKFGDAPRLLVADNLKNAKEIKLVTRRDNLIHDFNSLLTWGDPRFIK